MDRAQILEQGITDYENGRYEEALDAFVCSIELDPKDYYNLGRMLQQLGRSKQAEQAYKKA